MKSSLNFFKDIYKSRYLLYQLTKRDVTSKYKRSKLGVLWSFLEPLSFIGILYLVFGIGLRNGSTMKMPFLCYLVTGMAVVNFFTETLLRGTLAVRTHSYIIKKINIRLSIIPFSTVLSGIVNHCFFLVAASIVFMVNQVVPNLYWIQTLYYMLSLSCLLLGLSWFTASVGVYIADLAHVVNIVGRMLFYFTPVFWDINIFNPQLQKIIKINPLFYIVQGYRESLYYEIPFWKHPKLTIYFWIITIGAILVGSIIFRKLKPDFADNI